MQHSLCRQKKLDPHHTYYQAINIKTPPPNETPPLQNAPQAKNFETPHEKNAPQAKNFETPREKNAPQAKNFKTPKH